MTFTELRRRIAALLVCGALAGGLIGFVAAQPATACAISCAAGRRPGGPPPPNSDDHRVPTGPPFFARGVGGMLLICQEYWYTVRQYRVTECVPLGVVGWGWI